MIKAWPFTFFLAAFSFIYGLAALISETPFFVGSDSRKLKQIEWLYTKLGPEITGILFVALGSFLIYLSIKEYKNKESDFAGLTVILIIKILFVVAVIGYLFMAAIL